MFGIQPEKFTVVTRFFILDFVSRKKAKKKKKINLIYLYRYTILESNVN